MGITVNWDAIRLEYITGDMPYRALAAKHGVSLSALRLHGKAEGWPAQRAEHRTKIATDVAQKLATDMAKRATDQLSRLRGTADKLLDAVAAAAEALEAKEAVTPREVKDLAAALQGAVDVVRDLNGVPTVQQQAQIDVAWARLDLERARANQGVVDNSETGVVVMPEVVPLQEPSE